LEKIDRVWIGKPSQLSRGRGIFISRDIEEIETKMSEYLSKLTDKPPSFVLQEYIKNPLLVEGYKHDLRIYVLVTSFHPLTVYLYGNGLGRFCVKKFNIDDKDFLCHLTNTSIQEKTQSKINQDILDEFEKTMGGIFGDGDFVKRQLLSVFGYYKKNGYPVSQMWNEIKKVILLSLLPLTSNDKPPKKCFELFGFDILFDQTLKAKLIEINLAPSLAIPTPTDRIIKGNLVNSLLDTIDFPNFNEKENKNLIKIFPFNNDTKEASLNMANHINMDDNMNKIIENIKNIDSIKTNTN